MPRPNSRQQIVDAAIRLMAEGGAEALTASALAEAAGVSKANLFHHFASLDDIVLVAFEQFIMGMQSVTGVPPASLRQWLIELGAEAADTIAQQATLSGAYFAFASRAQSDPRLRARLEELATMAENAFVEIIGQLAPGMDASAPGHWRRCLCLPAMGWSSTAPCFRAASRPRTRDGRRLSISSHQRRNNNESHHLRSRHCWARGRFVAA